MKRVAVIMAAFQELGIEFDTKSKDYIPFCSCATASQELRQLYHSTAAETIDTRTGGTLRTWFSVFLYIIGIVAAFIPAFGGSSD